MDEIVRELVESVRSRYYGKYRGVVTDIADAERRARVRVKVPAVWGESVEHWALPCLPFGGLAEQGLFSVPEVGAQVWVEFEAGDPEFPIWTGTFWQRDDDVPADVQQDDGPTTRLFTTPAGHKLIFEDKDDAQQVHLEHSQGSNLDIDNEGIIALTDSGGARLVIDPGDGQILLEDSNGNSLTMNSSGTTVEDSNGNKINMAASGITVEGTQVVVQGQQVMLGGSGGEPVIKGQSFLTLFATHIHTSVPLGGPTSPPIPQGEMSTLSMQVTST